MDDRAAILEVAGVRKEYFHGPAYRRRRTFSLAADFRVSEPGIIGVMGGNGSGKTTLFEIITGSTPPSAGTVYCMGQDIQHVKYDERDRLAIHYHQSYQVRRMRWTRPNLMLESAGSDYPVVHLFDEPQFNTQDGYIGFMLDFFRKLRDDGRLVFMSVHPTEHLHLDIVREICERFMFVGGGTVTQYPTWERFVSDESVRAYLGQVLESYHGDSDTAGASHD